MKQASQKNLKQFFRSVLFIIFLCFLNQETHNLHAKPNVTDLKNTIAILNTPYQHLSPIHGALWSETPIIESMYRFDPNQLDPSKNSVNRLLRKLFYLNNDNVNFNTQQSPTEIAAHLTPFIIGQLVGLLEQEYRKKDVPAIEEPVEKKDEEKASLVSTELQTSIKKIITPAFEKLPEAFAQKLNQQDLLIQAQLVEAKLADEKAFQKSQDELRVLIRQQHDTKTFIAKLIKDIADRQIILAFGKDAKSPEDLEKKEASIEKYRALSLGRITALKKTGLEDMKKRLEAKQKEQTEATKSIEAKETILKPLITLYETKQQLMYTSKNLDKFSTEFAEIFMSALILCNDYDYPKHTVHRILLSFLWDISDNRTDLLKYLDGLQSILGSDIFTPTGQALFITDAPERKTWLDERFTQEEYESLSKDFTANPSAILNNQETAILNYLGFNVFRNSFPKELPYRNDIVYKGTMFPDCGETSIHNFLNLLLYNPVTQRFNLELLAFLTRNARDTNKRTMLIDFYTTSYRNPGDHDTKEAYNTWAAIVSEIKDVIYDKEALTLGKVCEIAPRGDGKLGIKNIEKAIEQLTGFANISELCRAVADDDKVGINLEDYNETIDNTVVTISFKLRARPVTWRFEPGHFVVQFPPIAQEIETKTLLTALKEAGMLKKNQDLMTWLSLYTNEPIDLVNNIGFLKKTISFSELLNYFLYAQRIKNFDVAGDIVNEIIDSAYPISSEDMTINLFKLIYSSLPANDEAPQNKFFQSFFVTDAPLVEFKKKFIHAITPTLTNEIQWLELIDAILTHTVRGLDETIFPHFSKLIKPESYRKIILAMLSNDELSRKFEPWINTAMITSLGTATGSFSPRVAVINAIIDNKKVTQFKESIRFLIQHISYEDQLELIPKIILNGSDNLFDDEINKILPREREKNIILDRVLRASADVHTSQNRHQALARRWVEKTIVSFSPQKRVLALSKMAAKWRFSVCAPIIAAVLKKMTDPSEEKISEEDSQQADNDKTDMLTILAKKITVDEKDEFIRLAHEVLATIIDSGKSSSSLKRIEATIDERFSDRGSKPYKKPIIPFDFD